MRARHFSPDCDRQATLPGHIQNLAHGGGALRGAQSRAGAAGREGAGLAKAERSSASGGKDDGYVAVAPILKRCAGRLQARDIAISMSRLANPYDNAKAESFMKTLKAEEVNGNAYKTLDHAKRDIGEFIETVYNTQRLHSALGYKPPVEFEAEFSQSRNRLPKAETALSPN
jgi:transposase InsO family protein